MINREIWYRHLPNDGSDMHTSLLTIEKTSLLDSGQYTCQVVDWEMQQCKSIYIDVKGESDVKVVPMSATLEKVNFNKSNSVFKFKFIHVFKLPI